MIGEILPSEVSAEEADEAMPLWGLLAIMDSGVATMTWSSSW